MTDWRGIVVTAAASVISALGGAGLTGWLHARAAKPTGDAALMDAVTARCELLMEGYQSQIEALEGKVAKLEADNTRCEQNGRQLAQKYDSLVGELRRRGIDIPWSKLPGTFVTIEGDHATIMQPALPLEPSA